MTIESIIAECDKLIEMQEENKKGTFLGGINISWSDGLLYDVNDKVTVNIVSSGGGVACTNMAMGYPVFIDEGADGGCCATVPDLPGCFACGCSIDNAVENAQEAIECHLERMMLDDKEIPLPLLENPNDSFQFFIRIKIDMIKLWNNVVKKKNKKMALCLNCKNWNNPDKPCFVHESFIQDCSIYQPKIKGE